MTVKLKEKMRVKVKSLGIKGRITYIDYRTLHLPFFHPVQIELDKPYDETGHKVYRTSFDDLVKLKKKKVEDKLKKVKKVEKQKPTKVNKKPKKKANNQISFDDLAWG